MRTLLAICVSVPALLACDVAPERSAVLSTSGAAGGALGGLSSSLGTASSIASAAAGTTGSLTASATGITSSTGSASGTLSTSGSLSGMTSSASGATSSTGATSNTGSTGACPAPTTIAAVRNPCNLGQTAAIPSATVLYADSSGAALDGGVGTKHSASYVLLDDTGLGVLAYHATSDVFPGYNPDSQDVVSASGTISVYPTGTGEVELSAPVFTFVSSSNPLPQPAAAAAPQLVAQPTDASMIAHYVTVPAGTYTQNYAEPAFTSGKYQDGVSITDGSGNTILVDFYPLAYSDYVDGASCYPTDDGGFPDLSAGGFNGFYDVAKTDDGNVNGVVFYGNCGQ